MNRGRRKIQDKILSLFFLIFLLFFQSCLFLSFFVLSSYLIFFCFILSNLIISYFIVFSLGLCCLILSFLSSIFIFVFIFIFIFVGRIEQTPEFPYPPPDSGGEYIWLHSETHTLLKLSIEKLKKCSIGADLIGDLIF